MNKTIYIFSIVAGAAVGGLITWAIVKKRYEKIAQDEINSVKEHYGKKPAATPIEPEEQQVTAERAKEKPDILEYASVIKKNGYASEEKDDAPKYRKPYVITPEDFGSIDGYDRVTFTYFSDGALTDENYEMVQDVDAIIGRESLNHFGEYEEDSVYVRNEKTKCDYEILYDLRKYRIVRKSMPKPVEV